MSVMQFAPYQVHAFNPAQASENLIHNDAYAKKFGFAGGFVPGVSVYAYSCHFPVKLWGRAWLERGQGSIRLLKPIFDGDDAVVTASETETGLDLKVESKGQVNSVGSAAMGKVTMPDIAAYPPTLPPNPRPDASPETLAVGLWLGVNPFTVTPAYLAQSLIDIGETNPIYAQEQIVHPVTILRVCNWSLSHSRKVGPWIHVGSQVQNLGLAHAGDTLTSRARVTKNFESKGHLLVELDVLVMANDTQPIAHVINTAIYRPRLVAAA